MLGEDPSIDYEVELIGQMLADARQLRGFTQTEVAERTGISRSAVSNIEAGRTDAVLTKILKIARVVGLGTAQLFGA